VSEPTVLRVGRYSVPISNPDKVLFPADGLTKLDLARYYAGVAKTMLRHIRDRPLVLRRYPRGIHGPGFVQQDFPEGGPPWVARVSTPKRGGGSIHHVVCHNEATLVYLANQNCITPHMWASTEKALERPDRLIFDLDPPTGEFAQVRMAALGVRAALDDLGLRSFVMTTGSRGLHVIVPLRQGPTYDEVRAFGRRLAELLAERYPDQLTVEQRIAKRNGRLYLDLGRNAYGQTAVAPYAVRARDGAPVATPLHWEELEDPDLTARRWTVATVPKRLAERGDAWADLSRHRQSMAAAARRLGRG
jgi:bifunctional non-homologous end joining protein LigD